MYDFAKQSTSKDAGMLLTIISVINQEEIIIQRYPQWLELSNSKVLPPLPPSTKTGLGNCF